MGRADDASRKMQTASRVWITACIHPRHKFVSEICAAAEDIASKAP